MTEIAEWNNFYVIVGSAAGALIGLQFVVITLIADRSRVRDDAPAGAAFATPSVVHFATVLFLSAILCAPWKGIETASALWGVMGLSGIVYTIVVAQRMRAQTLYRPVFEDWLFHSILPFVAYLMLSVSTLFAHSDDRLEMFFVAGAALSLLFTGIHNAWDAVTYHVFTRNKEHGGAERRG
ncbi:MAG TPA: hypothetical protein VMM58_10105 [Bacteroidota bacterium]|nr:hypothetical protein [Bacteroidota bacterium]